MDLARTRKWCRGGVLAGMWPALRSIRISTVPSPRHFENGHAGTAIDIADAAPVASRGGPRGRAAAPCESPRSRVESSRVGPAYFPRFIQSPNGRTIPRRTDRSLRHLDSVPHHLLVVVAHFLTPERSNRAYGTYARTRDFQSTFSALGIA